MTAFLRQRGLLRAAGQIMALVASSSGLIPLSYLVTQRDLAPAAMVVSVTAIVFTLSLTVYWLVSWPSRRQSQGMGLTGAALVTGWGFVQPSAGVAALACAALCVTGGYFAFFHNPRVLLFNVVLALASAGFAAARLTQETDVPTAVAGFWIIWFLNLSIPVAIRGMSQAMGLYATRAERDGLTGLLNRRSFGHALQRMLTEPSGGAARLTVMLADIDDFKRINDTYGHTEGDRVIRAVADLLREHCPAQAALCRAGGEEFLVAVTTTDSALPLAETLCAAIAAMPAGVTASVGVSHVDLPAVDHPDGDAMMAHLFAAADTAMYAAKRSGGNTVRLA